MSSKNIRNAIIALIILAIGAWGLLRIGKSYIPAGGLIDFASFISSTESLINLFLIGIVILIIILIPIWIAKKREEKSIKSTIDFHDRGILIFLCP